MRRATLIWMLIMATILITAIFTIMGYSIRRYKQDYYSNFQRFCDVTSENITNYSENNPDEDIFQRYLPQALEKSANGMGIFLYVFDADGNCVLSSSNVEASNDEIKMSPEMLSVIRKDGTYQTDHTAGKFDPTIAEPMFCRGSVMTIQEGGAEATYYLFAMSYTRVLNGYTTDILRVSVILMVIMLVLIGIGQTAALYAKERRMDSLIQAVQQYAQGNYDTPLDPSQYVGTELEELTQLMETISSQSQRAEESSRQFVSNVSHELRTPMTIISGFVDGILDGTVPKNKRMEYLSIVSQEVQRLKMLVTSMLNLTKFDAGTIQLNYRPFILNDTAFRIVLMFSNRLEKRNVEIEGLDSPPVRVCADPDLMSQVIYNLVENAVKFVNEGGTIKFTFSDTENEWIFAVRNTGNGISEEELPKIFERFYKSDASRSQDKTGLGLGLDITRRILHLHHAQISVRSEEHVFTEFEVRLPHVAFPEPELGETKEKRSNG